MNSRNSAILFSLEVKLFILVNCLYLSYLLAGEALRYIYFVTLALAYVCIFLKNVQIILFNKRTFFKIYLPILFLLICTGIYKSHFVPFILSDIISFSAPIFLLLPLSYPNKRVFFKEVFPRICLLINFVAIMLSIVFVMKYGLTMSSITGGRGLEINEGRVLSPKYFMYIPLITYPLVNFQVQKKHKLIFNIGLLMYLFFSLAMGSRATTLLVLFVLFLTKLSLLKSLKEVPYLINKSLKPLFITILLIAATYELFGSSLEFLLYRFESKSLLEDARFIEFEEIIKDFSFKDFMIGRGFGAANNYWIFSDLPNGVNNVHFGFLFILLKGGLLLLVLLYAFVLSKAFKLSKNKELRPYGIIIITLFLLEFSHTIYGNPIYVGYLFVAASASYLELKKNSLK